MVAVGTARWNGLGRRLGQNGDQNPRGAPSAVSRVTRELREGVVVLVTVLRWRAAVTLGHDTSLLAWMVPAPGDFGHV